MLHQRRQLAPFIFLILLSAAACVAHAQAGLGGTIRDLQGKPQMGVLVELFGPASTRDAFTDVQGHYEFRDVVPGIYQLRASAALYLPRLRTHLQLQPHGSSVVNLTLSGLFDDASWSITRGSRSSQRDDWNWTLRSPENRPILRVVDDGTAGRRGLEQDSPSSETHAGNTTTFSEGVFGASGLSDGFQIARRSRNQRTTLSAQSQVTRTDRSSSGSPLFFGTKLQSEGLDQAKSVVAARLETFPQIGNRYASGLTLVDFSSAERRAVGKVAMVEIGSQTQLVIAGHSTIISRPFLRVATSAFAGWIVNYAGAVSPDFARFEDAGVGASPAPAVLSTRNKVFTETGLHQQIGLRRTTAHAAFRLDYQHDMARRTAVSGQVLAVGRKGDAGLSQPNSPALDALTLDTGNGLFRAFAPSYSVNGFDLGADLSLGNAFSASGTYVRSMATPLSAAPTRVDQSIFANGPSQAFIAIAQGKSLRGGTKVNVSYRWQPSRALSVVAPYASTEIRPYLGVHFRQSVSAKQLGCDRVAILIDADNLLGEGYHTYPLGMQRVNVASAITEVHAGLAFSY